VKLNRRAVEVAAVAAVLGIVVATYDLLFSQWRHPLGFLLGMAAMPWMLLVIDNFRLRGWHQLVALWVGLTINTLLLLGFWRFLKELPARRRANRTPQV
jgi:hypothetical protein